jgi:uncharacterized protein YoxC
MTVYEVCAIAVTVGFLVLVVYLVITLSKMRVLLERSAITLRKLSVDTRAVTDEAVKLLENANKISHTVQHHMHAFNPVVDSIETVGTAMRSASMAFKSKSKPEPDVDVKENVIRLIDLAVVTAINWFQLNRRKSNGKK